jgi:hypothetical protein
MEYQSFALSQEVLTKNAREPLKGENMAPVASMGD